MRGPGLPDFVLVILLVHVAVLFWWGLGYALTLWTPLGRI